MADDQEQREWGLVVAFPDSSPSFVHGFEAGGIWQRMKSGQEAEIEVTTCADNREVLSRMALAEGWEIECKPSEVEGWKGTCGRIRERYIVFSREKPRPYGEGQHAQFGRDIITHHRDDFRRIPMGFAGLAEIVRLAPKAYRDWRLTRSIRAALAAPK